MNTIDPVQSNDFTIFIGIVVGAITVSILTGMQVKIPEANLNAKRIISYLSIAAIVATFIMNSTLGPHTIPVVIASVIVGYILACTKTRCFLSMVVFLSACGVGPS